MAAIVVGVDGSAGSAAALRFAADEAARTGREVVAVHAWSYPGGGATADAVFTAHRRALGEMVDRAHRDQPDAKIRPEVTEGEPAQVLLSAAEDAAMLVLGSHGYGRLMRALVGSVGAQCLRRAHCPVVIVPAARAARHPVAEMDYQPGPMV
ncbi:universal stress protein [Amycolatopsis methanolica]|uniref:Universal stress protein n=1 Tax=Amycolatopsis methanolica 239 TaxID=1068978 RepID=A0A076N1H0_AMYME|nr:universal stress protein [Amycolatopsis methanolica]AIJ23752.1 universal stress protein [Amycolatopsis methanolica 239]